MIRSIRTRLTYANVMSTIAVVAVIGGGTAVAASGVIDGAKIKRGSIKAPQLAVNSVNSTKVRNGSLLAADFKAGQLPAGPRGPQGPAGTPDTSAFYDKVASDARFARQDARIVHVSGSGAPAANGTALIQALAAVSPAPDAANPVLVVLGPGTFDLGSATLQLVDNVNITGAGSPSTIVRGTGTVLVHAATSELADLTLQHDMGSGGPYTTIVLDTADTLRFNRSELLTSTSGGGTRTGISASGGSAFLNLRDSRVLVRGGDTDTGIETSNATLNAYDTTVDITGTGTTHALRSGTGGGAVVFASRLRAISGTTKYAIARGAGSASVMQLGSTEVYGTLDATHTYYCGATFSSSTTPYSMLSGTCT